MGIITAEDAQADAGVTGAIGLYGGRLTEALGDVFSFAKPSGDNKRQLKQSGKTMFELEQEKTAMLLVNGGVFETKQQAKKYLNNQVGSFEKNYNKSLRNAKERLKGGSALDYERLAINETVLVYKLANSLKSKDRLTQKDIEMAKNLVKVFPLLRGERNVIASLTATAETILDDIKQQERLYERAGGSSQYLLNERRAYGLSTSDTLNTMTDLEDKRLKKLQEEGAYNAFALRCWPEMFTKYGGAICAPASISTENKVPCACEADVYGAVTQLILQEVSGQPVFLTDIVDIDVDDDTGVFWHCGQAPISMCNPKIKPTATIHSNRKMPLLFEFPLKEGIVTMMRISQSFGEQKMVLSKGKMIDVQQKIAADPRVFSVYDVTGDWDSIVMARVRDRADLDDLTKTVFTLEGVTRSFTHVVLNTVKEDGFAKPAPEKNIDE